MVVQPGAVVFGSHLQKRTWTVTWRGLRRRKEKWREAWGEALSEVEGLGGKKRRGLMTFDLGLGEEKDGPNLGMIVWWKVESMVNFPRPKFSKPRSPKCPLERSCVSALTISNISVCDF